jgi:hypothetical protein
MMPAMDQLSALPDDARLTLLPMEPALALGKLFAQFVHEGRCERWACERIAAGAILAIAYSGQEDLSGCSHDKIAHLLGTFAQRLGRPLLGAPPIVIEVDGVVRCLDRKAIRQLIAQGGITVQSQHWDLTPRTLGAWRHGGRSTAGATWLRAWFDATPTPPVPA